MEISRILTVIFFYTLWNFSLSQLNVQELDERTWHLGHCRKISTVNNFKLKDFYGTWYLYGNYPQKENELCVSYNFMEDNTSSTNRDEQTFAIEKHFLLKPIKKYIVDQYEGKIDLRFKEGTFSSDGAFISGEDDNIDVIFTDYKTVAVLWTCAVTPYVPFFNYDYIWVLVREKFPRKKTIKLLKKIFKRHKLRWYSLTKLSVLEAKVDEVCSHRNNTEVLKNTDVSKTREDLKTTEVQDKTKVIETTELSKITEAPKTIEDPKISEATKISEVPKTIEDPKISEATNNTEASKNIEVPKNNEEKEPLKFRKPLML